MGLGIVGRGPPSPVPMGHSTGPERCSPATPLGDLPWLGGHRGRAGRRAGVPAGGSGGAVWRGQGGSAGLGVLPHPRRGGVRGGGRRDAKRGEWASGRAVPRRVNVRCCLAASWARASADLFNPIWRGGKRGGEPFPRLNLVGFSYSRFRIWAANWRSFGTGRGWMSAGEVRLPSLPRPPELGRGGGVAQVGAAPGLRGTAVTRLSGQQPGERRRGGGAWRCPQGTRSPAMLGWTLQIALSP